MKLKKLTAELSLWELLATHAPRPTPHDNDDASDRSDAVTNGATWIQHYDSAQWGQLLISLNHNCAQLQIAVLLMESSQKFLSVYGKLFPE